MLGNAINKAVFVGALLLGAGMSLAQFAPEPQSSLEQETGQMRSVQVREITHNPPDATALLGACLGITGTPFGYIDTNLDGRPDILRVFGADRATRAQWEQVGSRLFGPLRQRAQLRAQGEAAQIIGVHVAVDNGMLDTFSADLDSIDITESSREQIRARSSEMLRGAAVSGQRIVSLENNEGICVIVRYDVPISGNRLPQGEVVPGAPRGAGEQQRTASPDFIMPPPGITGDF